MTRRLLLILVVAMIAVLIPAPALAAGGDDVGVESDFQPLTNQYAIGDSIGTTVGIRGSTNVRGWTAIKARTTCQFSNELLAAPGVLRGDEGVLQRWLVDNRIIEPGPTPDPITGEVDYVGKDGWASRFADFDYLVGGWAEGTPNCVQGGLGFYDNDCSAVPPAITVGIENPVRAGVGVWIISESAFLQGSHGDWGGYSFVCVEVYNAPDFTAAVLDQTELVIPRVTLEAQVRAAIGSTIGAWYSVSAADEGRNPYEDGFSIEVPTLGDPVPADVVLWLEKIRWDFDGDGEWDIVDICAPHEATDPPGTFDCGGSEEEPLGEFTFEYRGLYSPVVELQWDGYFIAHFAGFSTRGDFDTEDLITAHTLVDYPVIEIRSSLDG